MKAFMPSSHLVLHPDGIWRTRRQHTVFYPSNSHEKCFQVEDQSYWYKYRNEVIKAMVKRNSPSGTIFDIGGGNGFVSSGLIESGFPCVLVEPGESGAYNAKHRRKIPFVVCSPLQDAGFRPSSIPAIGMFDVLEHMEHDKDIIMLIHDLLASDGMLYLTVPSYSFLWSQADIDACHFRRYSIPDLKRLLSKGFTVQYASYFFQCLLLPILMFRAVPFRAGLYRQSSISRMKKEHQASMKKGVAYKMICKLSEREVSQIKQGKTLRYGASICLAARKN